MLFLGLCLFVRFCWQVVPRPFSKRGSSKQPTQLIIHNFPYQRAQQSGQWAQSHILTCCSTPLVCLCNQWFPSSASTTELPESWKPDYSPSSSSEISLQRTRTSAFTRKLAESWLPRCFFFVNLFSQLLFQFQNIAYSEYLPAIIGPKLMQEHNLQIGSGPTKYDPEADPRVSNEFATVSFCLMAFIAFIDHFFSCR